MAVSSLVHYDKWDHALAAGRRLYSQVLSATGTSPFELAHGFPARVPLNMSLSDLTAGVPGADGDAAAFALRTANRHQASADYAGTAQVHICRVLAARASPATVRGGPGPGVAQAMCHMYLIRYCTSWQISGLDRILFWR